MEIDQKVLKKKSLIYYSISSHPKVVKKKSEFFIFSVLTYVGSIQHMWTN